VNYAQLRSTRENKFITPAYAVKPLLKYLPREWRLWIPDVPSAFHIRRFAEVQGYEIVDIDITKDDACDDFDILIGVPDFQHKELWLKYGYSLGKPFAFLFPLTALEGRKRQQLYRQYGISLILFDSRINFLERRNGILVPTKNVWFAVAWFTWQVPLPRNLVFEVVEKVPLNMV
jgi:hypothetical protein